MAGGCRGGRDALRPDGTEGPCPAYTDLPNYVLKFPRTRGDGFEIGKDRVRGNSVLKLGGAGWDPSPGLGLPIMF